MSGNVLDHDGKVLLWGSVGVTLGAIGIGLHKSNSQWARVKYLYGIVKITALYGRKM